MALNAVVDAGAGGSVSLFREVFMNGEYLAGHPESADAIHLLKVAIDNQVRSSSLFYRREMMYAKMEFIGATY